MATIYESDGRGGIVIPIWLAAVICASALGSSGAVGFAAIRTWAKADMNYEKNTEQDKKDAEQDDRIRALEHAQLDMSAMQTDIRNVKDMQKATNDKLDRLLESEYGRHR